MVLLSSCSTDNNTANESEKVYQEYKAFVTEFERDTVVLESDLDGNWETHTDSLRAAFATHKSNVTAHLDNYEAERREEVNAFDDRFEVALEERQKKHDEISHRYKMRRELLGMEVSEDDMSSITAENIAATYEHFLNTLGNNLANYSAKDWNLIEGWWSALENRRQTLNEELQPEDQKTIAKHQETYQQLRDQALAQNTEEDAEKIAS